MYLLFHSPFIVTCIEKFFSKLILCAHVIHQSISHASEYIPCTTETMYADTLAEEGSESSQQLQEQ